MFKVLASLLVVAVAATTINAISIHAPFNHAANIFAPWSTVNQDNLQNQYDGYGYGYPGIGGNPGYPGHFQYPIIPGVPASAYDNVRIHVPVSHQMNLFSPNAQINSNNLQNLVSSNVGY